MVLVPFLLSVAVFTRLAVIDLSLPAQSNERSRSSTPTSLKLEVVIRADALEVSDRIGGADPAHPDNATGPDTDAVGADAGRSRRKFPQHDDATVLAEPNTSYDTLVQVMDAVRAGHQVQGSAVVALDCSPTSRSATRRSSQQCAAVEPTMKLTPLQKRTERRSRNQSMVDMNLVSLIDVFTILIFFLLSNAGGVETLPSPKAVKLPESMAQKQPRRR